MKDKIVFEELLITRVTLMFHDIKDNYSAEKKKEFLRRLKEENVSADTIKMLTGKII